MSARTKIVATLGPVTESLETLRSLVHAGMDIVRLNASHGDEAQFTDFVKKIRRIEKETGTCISIFLDLQGPKIRLGLLPKEGIPVSRNQVITLSTDEKDHEAIHVPYPPLLDALKVGDRLLIEDGLIRTKVLGIHGKRIQVKIQNSGILKSRKGINIPDSKLPNSESLTKKDQMDLLVGLKLKVDAVAVSFVERAQDVQRVRDFMQEKAKKQIPIIAKIERPKALKYLEEILSASDALMVARGDLGIETKAERVPIEQKRMVALARQSGKPVIIATQILQSMVSSPIATRAEVSDAANAIFDHADAFMLSNETAVGSYPIQAVQTLSRVAEATEEAIFKEKELFPSISPKTRFFKDESMALQACQAAEQVNVKAIVVVTQSGHTAQMVLKHRPQTPVLIVTPSQEIAHTVNFLWGANRIFVEKKLENSDTVANYLLKNKVLKKGDPIVFVRLSKKKRSLVIMDL